MCLGDTAVFVSRNGNGSSTGASLRPPVGCEKLHGSEGADNSISIRRDTGVVLRSSGKSRGASSNLHLAVSPTECNEDAHVDLQWRSR